MQVNEIAQQFQTGSVVQQVYPDMSGNTNQTWMVDLSDSTLAVLQRINTELYPDPNRLMSNFFLISNYLAQVESPLLYLKPFYTSTGDLLYIDDEGNSWRCYRYIAGTIERNIVDAGVASGLGYAAGELHRTLNDFPVEQLSPIIPNYHNTPKVYEQFARILERTPEQRQERVIGEIGYIHKQKSICPSLLEKNLPARATHNRINPNHLVLDAATRTPVALIDYDAFMPGILAFDFGDGARSVCFTNSPVEADMLKVQLDLDLFTRYVTGFLSRTKYILDDSEPSSLALGCIVMTLEQGIRLLSRYLASAQDNEASESELLRARVQLYLSIQMKEQYKEMVDIIKKCFLS